MDTQENTPALTQAELDEIAALFFGMTKTRQQAALVVLRAFYGGGDEASTLLELLAVLGDMTPAEQRGLLHTLTTEGWAA